MSNLRCSHGLFSALWPAECVAKQEKTVGEDAKSELVKQVSKRRRGKHNVKESKREKDRKEEWVGGGQGSKAWKNTCWQPVLGKTIALWWLIYKCDKKWCGGGEHEFHLHTTMRLYLPPWQEKLSWVFPGREEQNQLQKSNVHNPMLL